jgi:hypothetical protein
MAEERTGWGGTLWAAADLVTPMAIRVAATLRLADHIAAGTCTAEALAAAVDADPDAIARLLAHLVTAGVLIATGADTYGLTGLGEQLRDDDPARVRPWLDLEDAIGRADLCFVELLHTVRTGQPAFPRRLGRPYWEDLAADPERAASFDALMGARLGPTRPRSPQPPTPGAPSGPSSTSVAATAPSSSPSCPRMPTCAGRWSTWRVRWLEPSGPSDPRA